MLKKQPEISVIVPVYNVERYLNKCLDSILYSTFSEIEVILVNDGSTDNSEKICHEYVKKDARVKLIKQPNGGLSAARNAGFDKAKGKYVIFIDSDDYIDTTMLQKMHQAIETKNVALVGCNAWKVKGNGKKKIIRYLNVSEDVKTTVAAIGKELYKSSFHVWRFLFKRELIKDIRFPLIRFEDAPFMMQVYAKVNEVYLLAEPLYYYCQHQNTLSRVVCAENYSVLKIKDIAVNAFKNSPNKPYIEPYFWSWFAGNCTAWYWQIPAELQASFCAELEKILPYHTWLNFQKALTEENKTFYLFSRLPILTLRRHHNKTYIKLFGFIPLLKIRNKII